MARLINRRLFVTPLTVLAGGIGAISPVLDDVKLETVRIVIPDGHAGLTALQILSGGTPIFPYGTDPFLRGNNEIIDFAWDANIRANELEVLGFNVDIFPHTWTIRWTLADPGTSSPAVTVISPQAAPLQAATISDVLNLTGAADAAAGPSPADLAGLDVPALTSASGP